MPQFSTTLSDNDIVTEGKPMRSPVAFVLIGLNAACWATIAAAGDTTQGPSEKPGKIVATAPRQVDTTHGLSTAPEHAGASVTANLRGTNAGATASADQSPMLSATANIIIAHGSRYPGYAMAAVSAVGVGIEPALTSAARVITSRTGIDRAEAAASLASVQTATLRPMGTGAAAGNFTVVAVRPDATAQSVGGVLSAAAAASWKTGLTQGVESTNVRATVLASAPSVGVLTQRPGGVTPRTVGVWNSAARIGGSTQPIRNKH
jgi:hypothetical protein